MWDPSLLDGNGEPIRVLEKGFRPASVYEVRKFVCFIYVTALNHENCYPPLLDNWTNKGENPYAPPFKIQEREQISFRENTEDK